jgi:hypothetical protein
VARSPPPMTAAGALLVATPPYRPSEDVFGIGRARLDQTPEQPAQFGQCIISAIAQTAVYAMKPTPRRRAVFRVAKTSCCKNILRFDLNRNRFAQFVAMLSSTLTGLVFTRRQDSFCCSHRPNRNFLFQYSPRAISRMSQ